jgi:multimeric flavodoxin WrbA
MKIAVLNGSPKGTESITMQGMEYLRLKNPRVEFVAFQVAVEINRLVDNPDAFGELCAAVAACDAVLWVFPLYHFLVPAQLKRFIELVAEKKAELNFAGKYAAAMTTSIHIMDHTAHNYIRGVSEDWGMRFVDSFSGSDELLSEPGRRAIAGFGASLLDAIESKAPVQRQSLPLKRARFVYEPAPSGPAVEHKGLKILVLTDGAQSGGNAAAMVRSFRAAAGGNAEVVDLSQLKTGWCLECLRCGPAECVYEGSAGDGFIRMFTDKVLTADILVFAGDMEDRYLSWRFKLFFDRSFFRNHLPSYAGKQLAFIISGPLAQEPNLRQLLSAYPDAMKANNCGFVTDEGGDGAALDALLRELCLRAVRLAKEGYVSPPTFLGVGVRKILRDAVWGGLCFVFPKDHEYMSKNGLYDFPYKKLGAFLQARALYWLLKIPPVRDAFAARMKQGAVAPFKAQLAKAAAAEKVRAVIGPKTR